MLPQTIPATAARQHLPELIDQVAYSGARFQLAKHGKPIAALVSYADLQRLEALEDARDTALLREAIAASTEPGLSLMEVLQRRGLQESDLKDLSDA
jgi:prevent-host-death family protein